MNDVAIIDYILISIGSECTQKYSRSVAQLAPVAETLLKNAIGGVLRRELFAFHS